MSDLLTKKVPLSPGEFLAAQRRFVRMMIYDGYKVDVKGQLAMGQYATAALTCKISLEQGIAAFLLGRGEVGLSKDNEWAIFRRLCGPHSSIFLTGKSLLFRNPSGPEQVTLYATDCAHFIETVLGVDAAGYHSEESFAEYKENIEGINQLATLVMTRT